MRSFGREGRFIGRFRVGEITLECTVTLCFRVPSVTNVHAVIPPLKTPPLRLSYCSTVRIIQTFDLELNIMNTTHEDGFTSQVKSDSSLLVPPESRLCFFCRNIFDRWSEVVGESEAETGLPHFDDVRALKTSARNGCTLCIQFLKYQVPRVDTPETNSGTVSAAPVNAHAEPIDVIWNLQITFKLDNHFRLRIEALVVPAYRHGQYPRQFPGCSLC